MKTKKELFKTDVAHTNQVQACKIHPNNVNKMASVGFDGYLRVWDLKTLQLECMIEDRFAKGPEKVLQSLAWCPHLPKVNEKDQMTTLCAVATSAGTVKLIDTARNKVIQTIEIDE